MLSFLQAIRAINLLIVGLTLYSCWFFTANFLDNSLSFFPSIDFFNLIFTTILITAGGNLINDFYDLEADKINKPKRVYISHKISTQQALAIYVLLNLGALFATYWLCLRLQTLLFLWVDILVILALWMYAFKGKKSGLPGNFLVACLTALVPLLAFFFFQKAQIQPSVSTDFLSGIAKKYGNDWYFIFLAIFAFLFNYIREILKDLQDIKGDQMIDSHSLAIEVGEHKTRLILRVLLSFSLMILTIFILLNLSLVKIVFFLPILLIIILLVMAIFTFNSTSNKVLRRESLLLKLIFLLGISFPFWWHFFA